MAKPHRPGSKKNVQIRVCVDYHKLNAQTLDDPFLLPFTNAILDTVVDYEPYSFRDGFSHGQGS